MDNFIEAVEILAVADSAFMLAVFVWLLWKSENRILDKTQNMINAAIKVESNTQSFFQKMTDELNEIKTFVKDVDRTTHQTKALLLEERDRDSPTN